MLLQPFDKNRNFTSLVALKLIWQDAETNTNCKFIRIKKAGMVDKLLFVFSSHLNTGQCASIGDLCGWTSTGSLQSKFTSFGHLRFYLRYSSSEKLSRLSSSSLPSSSGRSPQSSRFCPIKYTQSSLVNVSNIHYICRKRSGQVWTGLSNLLHPVYWWWTQPHC